MKNQNERMEFVRDPKNWKFESAMPGIKLDSLHYKGATWYKLSIWMTFDGFDYEKRVETVKTEWQEIRMFKQNPDTLAFTRPMSATEIANEIKEIDKKGEAKK